MVYMLDTNIFIAALKAHASVRARLESLPASAVLLSTVVLGELETGVEKSAHVERNRTRLAAVVAGLRGIPVEALADAAYSNTLAALPRLAALVPAR